MFTSWCCFSGFAQNLNWVFSHSKGFGAESLFASLWFSGADPCWAPKGFRGRFHQRRRRFHQGRPRFYQGFTEVPPRFRQGSSSFAVSLVFWGRSVLRCQKVLWKVPPSLLCLPVPQLFFFSDLPFRTANTDPRALVARKLFKVPKNTSVFASSNPMEQSPHQFGGLRPSYHRRKRADIGSRYRCATCFFVVKAGSYAVGVWVNDWTAGHLVAEMMAILIEEMDQWNG